MPRHPAPRLHGTLCEHRERHGRADGGLRRSCEFDQVSFELDARCRRYYVFIIFDFGWADILSSQVGRRSLYDKCEAFRSGFPRRGGRPSDGAPLNGRL